MIEFQQGNYGYVAKATLRKQYGMSQMTVAVKVIRSDVSDDVKKSLLHEMKIMSKLKNENIVQIIGLCDIGLIFVPRLYDNLTLLFHISLNRQKFPSQ